ncbi:MAG: glycosyltransferase family 4 protein [Acidobacteriota bacterium]
MKIALVWNHRSRLLDCSFRFEQYLVGFEALGHAATVVCDHDSAQGFDGPLHVVETADQLATPEVWRATGAEVAVIVTWHRMPEVLQAMQGAGLQVIAVTDTDGQMGLRTFPRLSLERMLVYQPSPRGRLRVFKYWLTQWIKGIWRTSPEDLELLASTRASDAVILGSTEARRNFRRFLHGAGAGGLCDRLHVVPFTIGDALLSCPVPEHKRDCIVAIGRWDDPQKDAGLLAAALERFGETRPTTEVAILGRGGDAWFAGLERFAPRLRYVGVQQQEQVAHQLAEARSIVFSSRWEGCPHAALEALACGATVIGPAIPSLNSWADEGRFGTVTASRRPRALADAMVREMSAWDAGQRNAQDISRHWRQVLDPAVVCQAMLQALPPRR